MNYIASGLIFFPADDANWERINPTETGWDADALEDALEYARLNNSTGLCISYRGQIMAERYWEPDEAITCTLPEIATESHHFVYKGKTENRETIEDVSSVQKSLVAVLAGIARQKGLLAYDDPASKYLGVGWTNASPKQEERITIRHLMTMTSGLTPTLEYKEEPGKEWRYNSGAYHHVIEIVTAAAGMDSKNMTAEWVTGPLGMVNTVWEERDWVGPGADAAKRGLITTARDMVRFGIMVLAGGRWAHDSQIIERAALDEMLRPSQKLNKAYGQLWWLNGQESFIDLPTGKQIDGPFIKTAPADMVVAVGALHRRLCIVPSLGVVIARLGGMGPTLFHKPPIPFDQAFWEVLMKAAP